MTQNRQARIGRRSLLKATALAFPAAIARADTKLRLLAEGVVPFTREVPDLCGTSDPCAPRLCPFTLSPEFPPIPPDLLGALRVGAVQARLRIEFPVSQNHKLLRMHVFIASPGDPVPVPEDPPWSQPPSITVAHAEIREVLITRTPKPGFCLVGAWVSNEVTSPFGDLTGELAAFGAGFANVGSTRFTMLGGLGSGSHASFAPVAYGWIRL